MLKLLVELQNKPCVTVTFGKFIVTIAEYNGSLSKLKRKYKPNETPEVAHFDVLLFEQSKFGEFDYISLSKDPRFVEFKPDRNDSVSYNSFTERNHMQQPFWLLSYDRLCKLTAWLENNNV